MRRSSSSWSSALWWKIRSSFSSTRSIVVNGAPRGLKAMAWKHERPSSGRSVTRISARIGVIGDQDEVERRPVPPGQHEDGRRSAFVLQRDELVDIGPVLDDDEELLAGPVLLRRGDREVRREILAPEPQGRGIAQPIRHELVSSAPEDGFHEGFRNPALGLVEVHSALPARTAPRRGRYPAIVRMRPLKRRTPMSTRRRRSLSMPGVSANRTPSPGARN